MTKRKTKSRKASSVTALRLKAMRDRVARERAIDRAAKGAISQALSQTLLDLAFASGNR